MKNKSVAWAKKTNAIGMKLKEGCPPITYNELGFVSVQEFEKLMFIP